MTQKLIQLFVWVSVTAGLAVMAGCGEQQEAEESEGNVQNKSVEGVLTEAQLKALKDAKAIEKVIQDAEKERLDQVD